MGFGLFPVLAIMNFSWDKIESPAANEGQGEGSNSEHRLEQQYWKMFLVFMIAFCVFILSCGLDAVFY